jgi:hypothetical protein
MSAVIDASELDFELTLAPAAGVLDGFGQGFRASPPASKMLLVQPSLTLEHRRSIDRSIDRPAHFDAGFFRPTRLNHAQTPAQDALGAFAASKGWTAGVDASVAAATVGANGEIDLKALAPIVGFVLTNVGLMANLSLEGTRFIKLDP